MPDRNPFAPLYAPLRAAALAAALAAGAAVAPAAAQSGADVSAAEAEAFAMAAIQINEITRHYTARIQAAGAEAERAQLATEAREEIAGVLDETDDLDAQRYSEIVTAAEGDPQLAERLSRRIADELQ